MATSADFTLIRLLAAVDVTEYDDNFVLDLIGRAGSNYGAVSLLWKIKAAGYAKQVTMASGTTQITLSQRYDHAMQMASAFEQLAGGIGDAAGDEMTSVKMAAAAQSGDTEYVWDSPWPSAGIWATWERQRN